MACPNIEAILEKGGDITVGRVGPIDCVASASTSVDCPMMLGPIDVSTNGSKPQQPAEPTDPRLQPPQQPLPQPRDQAKGADDHG